MNALPSIITRQVVSIMNSTSRLICIPPDSCSASIFQPDLSHILNIACALLCDLEGHQCYTEFTTKHQTYFRKIKHQTYVKNNVIAH